MKCDRCDYDDALSCKQSRRDVTHCDSCDRWLCADCLKDMAAAAEWGQHELDEAEALGASAFMRHCEACDQSECPECWDCQD